MHPDLRLVNSGMSSHKECNLKPDLFTAHHPLIQYTAPYKNAPECDDKRLFGKFVDWENRSSIHCIWDAKWKIDINAFGEKCKYLQISGEDTLDEFGVEAKLRNILFDQLEISSFLSKSVLGLNQALERL